MTAGKYRVHIYLTGLDKSRAKELRYALADMIKGSGKATLRDMMKRAYEGERVLLYQTNSDEDANAFARGVMRAGAVLEIDGISVDEEPF